MEIQDYLKDKIQEFKRTVYNPEEHMGGFTFNDKEYQKRWKKDKENIDYSGIKNNEEVYRYITMFERQVDFFDTKVKRGIIEDAYIMNRELYYALTALFKMAQNLDNKFCDFKEISYEEVDQIFLRLSESVERMNEVNMRRACQD